MDPFALVLVAGSLTALTGAIVWLGSQVHSLAQRIARLEGMLEKEGS